MNLESFLEEIKPLKPHVRKRLKEFERFKREKKTFFDFRPFLDISFETDIYGEILFCTLTANSSAKIGIIAQSKLQRDFLNMEKDDISKALKDIGYRFWNARSTFLTENKRKLEKVAHLIFDKNISSFEKRELLSSKNSPFKLLGFGLKESSHLLRNLGFFDLAIIDRHILRFISKYGFKIETKTLTKKTYLEAENFIKELSKDLKMSIGELDLYIFGIESGYVLK